MTKSECCNVEIEINKSGFYGWCTACHSIIIFDRKGEIRKLEFSEKQEKVPIQTTLFDS